MTRKKGFCVKCERFMPITGRRLCSTCYWRERLNDNLEDYEKAQDSWKNIASEVISLYQSGLTAVQVGEKMGCSETTIRSILRKSGVKRRRTGYARKHTLNEHVFDEIDNEEAAYWLGFIYADGHARKDGLMIHLSIVDKGHIAKLRQFLESDAKITVRTEGRVTPAATMIVHSSFLSRRLKALGIVTGRGKFDLTRDNLPEHLHRHFTRGYLDGDGSISKPPSKPRVKIVGQTDILEWISNIISSNLDAPPRTQYFARNIYTIVYNGIYLAPTICEWLYRDSTICLERKYENFQSWSK